MGHIYIGYSRKDQDSVWRFVDQLRNEGYVIWADITNLSAGAEWRIEIQRAIDEADTYLLFYSPDAAESRWLREEIAYALMKRKPLIPVLLRPTQLPLSLATYQYIDATGDMESALRQIFLALEATIPTEQRQRQTTPVAEPIPIPATSAQVRAKSGVNWVLIGLITGVIGIVLVVILMTRSAPDDVSTTSTQAAYLRLTQASMTETGMAQVFMELSETATAPTSTLTDQPTTTSTPTRTPLPTETPQPLTAIALTAETLIPSETLSSISISNIQQTATTLAQTLIATRLTVTSQGVGGGESPTPAPATNEILGLEQIVGTLVAEALRTQNAPSTPISAASAIAATVIAIRATDNAGLSPQEAAILFSSNQNSVLLVGMTGALAVGLATATLVMVLIGLGTRLPRRTAHPSTSPGTPTASTATPEPLLQEYQIFISSSDKDREWIKIFVDDLQALGYLVWWYAKDAPGLPFGAEIRSAIYYTKVFVVIASPDSMKSKHVEEEVRWAEIYDRPIINVIYRETPVEDWLYGLAKGAAIAFTNEREYKGAMEQLTQAIDHLLQKRLAQVSGAHPPT